MKSSERMERKKEGFQAVINRVCAYYYDVIMFTDLQGKAVIYEHKNFGALSLLNVKFYKDSVKFKNDRNVMLFYVCKERFSIWPPIFEKADKMKCKTAL